MPDQGRSDYVWRNLSKEAFLQRNRQQLRREINAVNAVLGASYAPDVIHVTEADVWVLTYIEAGLTQGRVDPEFEHSEGERGMLPLPRNVRYWNGPSAPRWDRPMPLQQNLHHFFLYLGQLMNKVVRTTPRFTLYRDLFRWDSIKGDPQKQVQLLAGVVHGYFVSTNFTDGRVPFDEILNRFAAGLGPDAVMAGTRYKHAGTSILTNRARNIASALRLLGQSEQVFQSVSQDSGPLEFATSEEVYAPSIVRMLGETEVSTSRNSRRVKVKFPDTEALQAALTRPEISGRDTGKVNWKRKTLVLEEGPAENLAMGQDSEELVTHFDAKIIPDQQYEIDGIFDSAPESPGDPTLDDVVAMIRADRVWSKTRGAGVTIAVIDTGIYGDRPEFRNKRSWHRGYAAQPHLSPWEDDNGHGTMCAAIAAGEGGIGFARYGIAPEAHLLPCRAPNFYDSEIVDFYDKLIERAKNGETIVATNSFGLVTGSVPPPSEDNDLRDALIEAESVGIHIFFSAGNNHEMTGAPHGACGPNSIWRHKSYECLASVGTCNLDGGMWSYSSRGPGQFYKEIGSTREKPDFIAPTPRNGRIAYGQQDRTLATGWGTSGACPQAAGLAALILSLDPTLTPADVRTIIASTAIRLGGLGSTCQGAGHIDCEKALKPLSVARRQGRMLGRREERPSA